MSRPLRIEYLGAWYHIMNRGLGRRRIFRSDKDHHYFLSLLADATDRFNAEWHAYCLMSNHYHLMLRTPDGKLQRIMRHINGLYTQYFNRSHKRDGPLFRGRYKAVLVDAESHWLQLSRYVHRNPAEAGLVQRLADYPWSSYCAYIELTEPPPWLTTKYLLQAAGQRQRTTRYAAFVEQRIDLGLSRTRTDAGGRPRDQFPTEKDPTPASPTRRDCAIQDGDGAIDIAERQREATPDEIDRAQTTGADRGEDRKRLD